MLFSQRLFVKHRRFYIRPTQNRNLPKRPYPDVMETQKFVLIHVTVMNATKI